MDSTPFGSELERQVEERTAALTQANAALQSCVSGTPNTCTPAGNSSRAMALVLS